MRKVIFVFLVMSILMMVSCVLQQSGSLKVSVNDSELSDGISLTRNDSITITVSGIQQPYTYKLVFGDKEITVISNTQSTAQTFKLKQFNQQLSFTKESFNTEKELKITVLGANNASISKNYKVKLLNNAPKIILTPDQITQSTKEINISIIDEDDDQFTFEVTLTDASGTTNIYQTNNIRLDTLKPSSYTLNVTATDSFDEKSEVIRTFKISESGVVTTQNSTPTVRFIQPHDNEITPRSLTLRWQGYDPDENENLKYTLEVAQSNNKIYELETSSSEAILPNLQVNTLYTATVTIFDKFGAFSSDTVTFRTENFPSYSYSISRTGDGKSLLQILKVFNPESITLLGYCEVDKVLVDMDMAEEYIYAVGDTKLYVISAHDKEKPKVIKEIELGGTAHTIRLYKNYAIVGLGTVGITVVDLKNPADPVVNSRDFGKIVSKIDLKSSSQVLSKLSTSPNRIDITRGLISKMDILGDKLYVAADIAGLLEVNLENLPKLDIRDVNIIDGNSEVSTLTVGMIDGKLSVVYVKDSNKVAIYDTQAATVTNTSQLASSKIEAIRIEPDGSNVVIITKDNIYTWDGQSSNLVTVGTLLGNNLKSVEVIKKDNDEYYLLGDTIEGIIVYKNKQKYEENKISEAREVTTMYGFVFGIGTVKEGRGLFAFDARDPKNIEKVDVKTDNTYRNMSARLTTDSKYKIAVIKNENQIDLYEFDFSTKKFSNPTTITLQSTITYVSDVCIDYQSNFYVLATDGSNWVVQKYDQSGQFQTEYAIPAQLPANNFELPSEIQGFRTKFVSPISPSSVEIIQNELSIDKETIGVLVSLAQAGTILLNSSLTSYRYIFTSYYETEKDENGNIIDVKNIRLGSDNHSIANKYGTEIFVADGRNGIWFMTGSGENQYDESSKSLQEVSTISHLFWKANKLYASQGNYGLSIVDTEAKSVISRLNFSGEVFFHQSSVENDILFIATDKGLYLYNASDPSDPKAIGSLNIPTYLILSR